MQLETSSGLLIDPYYFYDTEQVVENLLKKESSNSTGNSTNKVETSFMNDIGTEISATIVNVVLIEVLE